MQPTLATPERATQLRVIDLFQHAPALGYRFLGNWSRRADNSNIEAEILGAWLTSRGHTPAQISRALEILRRTAHNPNNSLFINNRDIYQLLRYGVQIKTEAGQNTETLHLIDWATPANNDFALAEEVTLRGAQERRPDVVLYVNGLAVAVLELKNSRVSVNEGIRQSLSNQQPEFNAWFFSTVQFIFAGNDSQGLRYGTTGTLEKYFLTWKEDETDNAGFKLDKYLQKLCAPARLLELMHDFVLFDGGVKKLPRVHQYFGLKAAQTHVRERRSGIIWHSQGAGKSILMVLLAKWILEHNPRARVVIVTDRDELDEQIERVFGAAGETIARARSGRDLLAQLGQPTPRLLCSLVHKFGRRDVDDLDAFLRDLQNQPSPTVGELFVFVDECHRTQSGTLHRTMKALMPDAVFIGFTGTPLLKKDKPTSQEVFGGYIHTYKFSEAVADGVVLDLVYEARDIDQRLGSPEKIDTWFETKTRGLNAWQRHALKKQWGTLQNVLSSRSRMERVVADIVFDFATKPRLANQRGNAILVAASIYEACKYFTLFQQTEFKGRCAIVTSYNPQARDVTLEETGAQTETDKQFIHTTYTTLLQTVDALSGKSKTESYEDDAKKRFIAAPAEMRLLIVVDKLLTGFDAPPCTYLYIDKSMQDHGLFQAICRTNRLDGDDKTFGHIVDYKDLFRKVENAIAVYTAELDHSDGGASPEVLLQDRLTRGRERLDAAFEALALLCEPVEPPRGMLEHQHYFCGNPEIPTDLAERAPLRAELYKATASLLRAWADLADELEAASYRPDAVARLRERLAHYVALREHIRQASNEVLDLKAYEADMRFLIDTFIEAEAPKTISPFDNLSLLQLIVKTGVAQAIAERLGGLRDNPQAVAEAIENNVRSTLIRTQMNDPAFFERMSALLDEVIQARKHNAIAYEDYLQRLATLAAQVEAGQAPNLPPQLDTDGKRALYSNLPEAASLHAAEADAPYGSDADPRLTLALRLDAEVKRACPDGWRGVPAKEKSVKRALFEVLKNVAEVERLFAIVKAQGEY